MILKRLELSGFKSFAAKTVLDFPARVVAIVGPNGSGKSNVIDAIRWLLGERDAKNLRGGKIEDLIFSGTPGRARSGMAQSALYFDNSSGFFPVDFSEVSIARQIARDGESRYFLNNAEVRLKDIVDFLARSRLGSKGLTIIGQGSSDLFIKSTPEERRFMIEEILGLREYQLKKIDAIRKLETTGINLDKTRALIEEIKPHLRVLKRQAEKWEQRGAIEKELYALECFFFGSKLAEVERGILTMYPELERLQMTVATKKSELVGLEREFSAVEGRAPEQKKEIEELKRARAQLLTKRGDMERELGRLEAQLEMLERSAKKEERHIAPERAVSLIKKIRKELEAFLPLEIEEVKIRVATLLGEIDMVFEGEKEDPNLQEIEKLRRMNGEALTSLVLVDGELKKLEGRETELAAELEGYNHLFKGSIEAMEVKKQEIAKLESEKNKMLFEKERYDLRRNDIEMQLRERSLDFEQLLRDFKGGAAKMQVQLADAERKILRMRGELAGIGEIDEGLLKEYRDTDARYQFLITQAEDLDKATADLRNLVAELDQKIHVEFAKSMKSINEEFEKYFKLMFGGGSAKLKLKKQLRRSDRESEVGAPTMPEETSVGGDEEEQKESEAGIDVELSLPRKKITSLEVLSGGEKSLVSIAALFALVSVSPPPFLVLDEIDAPLDEKNARRFAEMLREFAKKTQFVVVTHNRATMEAADVLYGVTLSEDGTSKILSLKLES